MKGFVYLFRQKGTGFIKIGMTNSDSIQNRWIPFQMYSPQGAEIVHIIETENARKLERELHIKYASKRLEGEFFNLTDDDILDIKELKNDIVNELLEIFWVQVVGAKMDVKNFKSCLGLERRRVSMMDDEEVIVKFIKDNYHEKWVSNQTLFNELKKNDIVIKSTKRLGTILKDRFFQTLKFIDGKTQRLYHIC